MNDLLPKLESLQKKQALLAKYYQKILSLEADRKLVTKKLNKTKEKFAQLLNSEPDPKHLILFDDIDQFLIDIESDFPNA